MQNATLSLLFTIVDRGKGENVTRLLQKDGVGNHLIALGTGTAHRDLMSLLGLRDTEKDVVVTFLPAQKANRAMRRLSHALEIDLPGKGIAFTVPLSSVAGKRTLNFLMGGEAPAAPGEERKTMQQENIQNDLVIAIVNRGFTDLVMDAARPAGARGGTVLHARGVGAREAAQFFHITIEPEKEMVLIIVDHDKKIPVMQAIVRGAGLNTEGSGIVFSLPVTSVMGLKTPEAEEMQEEGDEA